MTHTSSIITLDNLDDLPPWVPDAASHLFAIVDMGSNGIRFTITDMTPPNSRLLRCIFRERADISLYDALNSNADRASGAALSFPPETIVQVSETLARFRRIASSYGVPEANFSVLATEAMRRAANAADMLGAIRESSGLDVRILAPAVETLFGAVMGSRSAFVNIDRGGLFLDMGGGSVQMTWVDTRLPSYEIAAAAAGESMPFGAARLIRLLEAEPAEVRTSETGKLRQTMQAAFARLCDTFPGCRERADSSEGLDVFMCGGGLRGYGCILQHCDRIQPYPIASVGTYTVTGGFFKQTAKMRKVNDEYDGKIYGMSKRRRQQFPAIAEVVEAFIKAVPNIRTVTFCAGSNRDGTLYMKLPEKIRESNPLEVLAGVASEDLPIAHAVLDMLRSAVPPSVEIGTIPSIFSLGLGLLFVRQIWMHQGEDEDANASSALHEAITRDPGAPGLTHTTRSILALAVCSRWGANLGPVDTELHHNLKRLLGDIDAEAPFWADYLGAVAAVLVDIVPAWPRSLDAMTTNIRFEATADKTKKERDRINLTVFVSADAAKGIDTETVKERFSNVGRMKGEKKPDKKVKVHIELMNQDKS
ncbi:hypothetical protein VDGD_03076 [Verticillium dahliae]|nr:hypothetical protein VDGD_03076 [Verticillium dahliae]